MKRPSFQFYPADWRNNAKLRRCSWAARGAWVDVMGLLHDSDEYGILHWPLKEIAQALGCPISLLKELAQKGVLKGADKGAMPEFSYTPVSGRKKGPTVVLIAQQDGPIWYCSRMVRDEYIRQKKANNDLYSHSPNYSPNNSPMPPIGEGINAAPMPPFSDLPTSTSSSTSVNPKEKNSTPPPSGNTQTSLPPDGGAANSDSENLGATDDKAIAFATGVPALVRLGMAEKGAKSMVGKIIKEAGEEAAVRICGRLVAIEKAPNPAALVMMLIGEEKDPIFLALRERYGECRKLPDGRYQSGNRHFTREGNQEVSL